MFGFVRFYLVEEYAKVNIIFRKYQKNLEKPTKNAIKYYKKD